MVNNVRVYPRTLFIVQCFLTSVREPEMPEYLIITNNQQAGMAVSKLHAPPLRWENL